MIFEGRQATDSGTEKDATSRWIRIDLASLLQRLMGCSKCELGIPIGAPTFFGVVEEWRRIKVIDPTLDVLDRATKASPKSFFSHAAVREHSNTGNGNATELH